MDGMEFFRSGVEEAMAWYGTGMESGILTRTKCTGRLSDGKEPHIWKSIDVDMCTRDLIICRSGSVDVIA